jgi:site-specific recombinase XerD
VVRLRLYRRHVRACRHKSKGQYFTGCTCPIWAVGEIDGRPYRQSLGLRDWNSAVRRIEEIEREPLKAASRRVTLATAIDAFLRDCTARHLEPSTVLRYQKVFDAFEGFCAKRGVSELWPIDVQFLSDYRGGRKIAASTQATEIELLRAWGAFCLVRGWMPDNPAKSIRAPSNDSEPTLPFTTDEVAALLNACDRIENAYGASAARARIRARALVLVLLYSGLRISDVGKLERSKITADGRLFLRAMKNKVPVYVRLPQPVLDALAALPVESDRFYFWSGRGKLSSLLGSLRRTVDCLGKLAGINAHPHRFRDTFSVRLLEHGAPMRTVQILLGHASIKTTERHYAPFLRSHQQMLDDAVARLDFVPAPSSQPGTPEAQIPESGS